jgi:hypothetical protein
MVLPESIGWQVFFIIQHVPQIASIFIGVMIALVKLHTPPQFYPKPAMTKQFL